ncbi:YrzI family small protein [Bacillus suaedaesalsae]|uniref:YrzI family small protein n=1 Tax=Bacillus suaedaesalsae TaxID=2810349 RepID=A0ABS2DMG5_9BACI|nr:YrzI family small protein [Bacillus suaedaesalsae]MBM6619667.1 YrzI family small protein [Bacillus suaedaesalsae]
MIPFHLFLFTLFTKKKEVTVDQYKHDLLVKKLRDKSLNNRHKMYPYI